MATLADNGAGRFRSLTMVETVDLGLLRRLRPQRRRRLPRVRRAVQPRRLDSGRARRLVVDGARIAQPGQRPLPRRLRAGGDAELRCRRSRRALPARQQRHLLPGWPSRRQRLGGREPDGERHRSWRATYAAWCPGRCRRRGAPPPAASASTPCGPRPWPLDRSRWPAATATATPRSATPRAARSTAAWPSAPRSGAALQPLEAATSNQAVADTAGVILTRGGAPVSAMYSSSTGGLTAGALFPSVVDAGDDVSPHHNWTVDVPVATIQAKWPAIGALAQHRRHPAQRARRMGRASHAGGAAGIGRRPDADRGPVPARHRAEVDLDPRRARMQQPGDRDAACRGRPDGLPRRGSRPHRRLSDRLERAPDERDGRLRAAGPGRRARRCPRGGRDGGHDEPDGGRRVRRRLRHGLPVRVGPAVGLEPELSAPPRRCRTWSPCRSTGMATSASSSRPRAT